VSPSYTPDIAAATRALLAGGAASGVYHCVNTGHATWAVIASEAAQMVGKPLRVKELTLETAALAARRPKFCALSNGRLAGLGIHMPTWQDALRRYVADQQYQSAS
jgi:dTDP-4-dehydrorhamnose reductase